MCGHIQEIHNLSKYIYFLRQSCNVPDIKTHMVCLFFTQTLFLQHSYCSLRISHLIIAMVCVTLYHRLCIVVLHIETRFQQSR